MRASIRLPEDFRAQLSSWGIEPSDLVLYINSGCNLRCIHCYIGNDLLDASTSYSASSINDVINQFPILERVTILGGEPLLHREIDSIISNAIRRDIGELRITTNLTNISKFDYKRYAQGRLVLTVSLDGHDSLLHDSIRGKGAFEATMRNLLLLLNEGYDIEITHTVNALNLRHLFDFVSLCKSLGIRKLNLHKVSLQGNAKVNNKLYVSPTTWVSLCEQLKREAMSGHNWGTASLRIRYPVMYATREGYWDMMRKGEYHHLAEYSFYSKTKGQRVVIYPDGKLFISSEAFGSDSYIGYIESEKLIFNDKPENELALFSLSNASIDIINPTQKGDENYPVALSVSFKKTLFI